VDDHAHRRKRIHALRSRGTRRTGDLLLESSCWCGRGGGMAVVICFASYMPICPAQSGIRFLVLSYPRRHRPILRCGKPGVIPSRPESQWRMRPLRPAHRFFSTVDNSNQRGRGRIEPRKPLTCDLIAARVSGSTARITKKCCCCTKSVQLTSSAIQHIIAQVPSTAPRPCFSLPAMGAGRSGFHAYSGC
jgi:hypothetical protein